MTFSSEQLRSDRRVAVGVFFVVLAIYLLTYVGAFKSNDERALFSGLDSFVKRGSFTANQIFWDYTNVGMLTSRGDMVPNYEPAQMLASIPFYLWGRALGAAVQGTLFFGLVVTAASVALLHLSFLELGYHRRTGVLAAAVFAFATLAWPYSRTFFREPLTTLMYLLAFYALLRYRPPAARRWIWPALAGSGLGLAFLTKQISIALAPSLVLLSIAYEWRRPSEPGSTLHRNRTMMMAAGLIPLALLILVGRVYSVLTLGDVEVFARNIVDYTTNPQLSQSVPIRMLRALAGITISPYKGLFWYCPALILGLLGAVQFTRRHRWEGIAALLIVGGHVLGYSRYNYWSGGVAWGMRYLLPVIPFLVLLAAPIWSWLVKEPAPDDLPLAPSQRGLVRRVPAWLLIIVSIIIQMLGVSIDLRAHEVKWLLEQIPIWGGLGQAIEGLYMRPAHSPILGHFRLLLSGTQPLDFAWVQLRPQGAWAIMPAGLIASLGLVGLTVAGLAAIWRQPRRTTGISVGLTVAAVSVSSVLLSLYRQGDSRFDPYAVDRFLRPAITILGDVTCPKSHLLGPTVCNDVLLVPDPTLTDYFLNYMHPPLMWYDVDERPADDKLLTQLAARYGRIWLLRDRNAETDEREDRRQWERYLVEHAYKLSERRFEEWARLIEFSAAGMIVEVSKPKQVLGDMTLEQATLGIQHRIGGGNALEPPQLLTDGQVQAQQGDILQIGLQWRAMKVPEANYTVFVQLLNSADEVTAQSDRWPGDGLYPTASLSAGQMITDNLALHLDIPPGSYRLIAGLYRNDLPEFPRLTSPSGDFSMLSKVEVQ